MKQEQQTGKRIVSKREYAAVQAKRWSVRIGGAVIFLIALLLATFGVVPLLLILVRIGNTPALPNHNRQHLALAGLSFLILTLFGTVFKLGQWGRNMARQGASIDPGIPLTRHNTADLPAPDSLVRASSKPVQAQEAVLLRAAAQEVETPAEELVRASVGQE